MPGKLHTTIGKLAWESLPAKDKESWNISNGIPADAPPFIKDALCQSQSQADKFGVYCHFLDLMGWEASEYSSYPEFLLDGKPVPHGAADHNLDQCMISPCLPDPESHRIVLRNFVEKAVKQVRESNMEKALLFAGLISHVIQDGAVLGHILPNSLFYELAPIEDNLVCDYHTMIDCCEPVLESVVPKILGTSVAEIVFNLAALMDENIAYARKNFFPILEACRQNDFSRLNQIMRIPLQQSVFQTASLLKSLLYIDSKEVTLDDVKLTELIPFNVHPSSSYRYLTVNHNVENGKLVPLRVNYGAGPKTINDGIGLSSFFSARYLVEPGVFKFLKGEIALSCDYLDDQQQDMDVEFFIGIDRSYNQKIASDLNYGPGMDKVYSIKLKPGMVPQAFCVEIKDAKTLLIAAISHPKIINGKPKYFFPHIILIKPSLTNAVI